MENASFVISVVIEGIVHCVYVIKRPGCDEFLQKLAEHYELLIYTASLSKYADPLLDILDPKNVSMFISLSKIGTYAASCVVGQQTIVSRALCVL